MNTRHVYTFFWHPWCMYNMFWLVYTFLKISGRISKTLIMLGRGDRNEAGGGQGDLYKPLNIFCELNHISCSINYILKLSPDTPLII